MSLYGRTEAEIVSDFSLVFGLVVQFQGSSRWRAFLGSRRSGFLEPDRNVCTAWLFSFNDPHHYDPKPTLFPSCITCRKKLSWQDLNQREHSTHHSCSVRTVVRGRCLWAGTVSWKPPYSQMLERWTQKDQAVCSRSLREKGARPSQHSASLCHQLFKTFISVTHTVVSGTYLLILVLPGGRKTLLPLSVTTGAMPCLTKYSTVCSCWSRMHYVLPISNCIRVQHH